MEYNFNTWTEPTPTDPPSIPGPFYYPDLSGNGYNLDDNMGVSYGAGDGPAGDSGGNCLHLYDVNTYFGINTSVNDSNFEWNTAGTISLFFCMKIMDIPPSNEFFPLISNYALTFPYWNIYLKFSPALDSIAAGFSLIYEEVNSTGIVFSVVSSKMSVDYGWHTYAITLNRSTGTGIFYLDAVESSQKAWDTTKNIDVQAYQHEIILYGAGNIPDYGNLTSRPPVPLRFDGTEFYDNILSLGDIQTLHANYM